MHLSCIFSKACFKVVVRTVKNSEAIVFLVNIYVLLSTSVVNDTNV